MLIFDDVSLLSIEYVVYCWSSRTAAALSACLFLRAELHLYGENFDNMVDFFVLKNAHTLFIFELNDFNGGDRLKNAHALMVFVANPFGGYDMFEARPRSICP